MRKHLTHIPLLFLTLALAACGSDEVDSEEGARAAYLGLDQAVVKAMQLGFDGFNASAGSANIPPQMTTGAVTGTMVISGQVDSGASDNKGMRLDMLLTDYRDTPDDAEIVVTYDTGEAVDEQPDIVFTLRNIPDGTLQGTLMGVFHMTGDLEGDVRLNLTFSGTIESDGMGGTRRQAGTTHVTGTATSSYGTYNVDVMI